MTVFILGAGQMQEPALRIARELGFRVVAADGNPRAPAAVLADRFFPVDLKDFEGLSAACEATRVESGLDAVFTAGTDFSWMVARLARRFGLPGHEPEAAFRASDKPAMRAALAAAGVPSPRHVEVSSLAEGLELARSLGFPLVVKPADSMGARGCRRVDEAAALESALRDALPHSRTGRAIVEEFIDGPEFSIDALVSGGRIRIRGLADRHIHFAPYFVELGHTMPSSAPEPVRRAVLEVFERGVRALGLEHGAAKGDIKYSPTRGGAFVGEIAARLSGGFMSGWTYPYASGIDVTREALLLAAGLDPFASGASDRGWASAERAFISIPGKVRGLYGLREAANAPFVKQVYPRVQAGERVVFPRNNVEKCGNVISQAPDGAAAAAAADRAVADILVRLEAPNPETEAFLAEGAERGWPPSAFPLDAGLLAAIEKLPAAPPGAPLVSGAGPLELLVPALPEAARVGARDWSGRSLQESAELALRLGGGRFWVEGERSSGLPVDGRRFWLALLRAGAQGGLYVLDGLSGSRP